MAMTPPAAPGPGTPAPAPTPATPPAPPAPPAPPTGGPNWMVPVGIVTLLALLALAFFGGRALSNGNDGTPTADPAPVTTTTAAPAPPTTAVTTPTTAAPAPAPTTPPTTASPTGAPNGGTEGGGGSNCPSTTAANQATSSDVQRVGGEACAYTLRVAALGSTGTTCSTGWICTYTIGETQVFTGQDGNSYNGVTAGTVRFISAYPAGDAVYTPCALVANEDAFGQQQDPPFHVFAGNFSC